MFESMKEHPDLIFNDATVQLVEVSQPSIDAYLGTDLIALLHRTDDRICNTATNLNINKSILVLVSILSLFSFL
jgi:hypothetical protein